MKEKIGLKAEDKVSKFQRLRCKMGFHVKNSRYWNTFRPGAEFVG